MLLKKRYSAISTIIQIQLHHIFKGTAMYEILYNSISFNNKLNSDTVELQKDIERLHVISDSFAQLLSNKRIMVLVNDTIFPYNYMAKDYSNLKDEGGMENKIGLLEK